MKGNFLWKKGSGGMAYPMDPDQLIKASSSWALDIDALAPWTTMSFTDEPENQFWVSGADKKTDQLIITGPCSSSMDIAWHFISKKILMEWGSILSLSQWNGRGQLGRMWVSPVGNIYSAVQIPSPPQPWHNLLPLIVGFSLLQSFAQIDINMMLKWPNDLVMDNKKVGGVLIERKEDMVVVGVGLNLISNPVKEQLRNHNVIAAASLKDFGFNFTPFGLWKNLIGRCRDNFKEIIETKTPSEFVTLIHEYLAFKDNMVNFTDHENKTCKAIVMGLAETGGLKLLINNKIKIVQSGYICP